MIITTIITEFKLVLLCRSCIYSSENNRQFLYENSQVYNKEEQLKSSIVFAREYLKETKISKQQLLYLCEEAVRGGCQGHRAEITAARVAMASAALEDAPVRADDLRLGVKLAIFPRSRFAQDMPQEDMMPPPPPPPSKAPQPENNMDDKKGYKYFEY